jgi:hypothetical protein
MTQDQTPATVTSTKWWNFFERVLWTLLQAASADVILKIWEYVNGPVEPETRGLLLVLMTGALAAIKNGAAQAFGSPTGATLPSRVAPVPAERVAVEDVAGRLVASNASELANGTPVDVWKVAA